MKKNIVFVLLIALCTQAFCQDKAQLLAEIEAAQQANFKGFEVFFNSASPASTRINAISTFSGIFDEKQKAQAAELVLNPKEAATIRAAALTHLTDQVIKDEKLWNQVLIWVQNPASGKELRDAALFTLEMLSFSALGVDEKRIETNKTLRTLTRDPDIRFRRFALAYLAAHGDTFTQSLLIDQLERKSVELVPTAEAMGILALNIHGDYLPTFNKVFQNPPDSASLRHGIMFLGNYLPAKEKIGSLFKNKNQNLDIRELALLSLLKNYPDEADALSVTVLNDKLEPPTFKILVIMNAMYKRKAEWERYQKLGPDTLHEIIKNIAESSAYPLLQETAEEYLETVQVVY